MFDFDFCNALPVRARVVSGTITAIYYYYYYYYQCEASTWRHEAHCAAVVEVDAAAAVPDSDAAEVVAACTGA